MNRETDTTQLRVLGTVKWFDREKGFGFIRVDESETEVFVHYSQILMTGFKVLDEGQRVSLELGSENDRAQAERVEPHVVEND